MKLRRTTLGGRRCDGRLNFDQIRPIKCEVGMLDGAVHGCSIFQRGQTQVLGTLTLDSLSTFLQQQHNKSSRILRQLSPCSQLPPPFVLHYEFAPYSTGSLEEDNKSGLSRPNRRELGHGALAERALSPAFPRDYEFCARVLCEVLESNGSSSMAAVCAGSLCLMDGAVPIKRHVAGVAMGLIAAAAENDDTSQTILTDINGMEDHSGDMDCKIAGDANAVTALQLDVKIADGVCMRVLEEALSKARVARKFILERMSESIACPRTFSRNKNHPVVRQLTIPTTKRLDFLGHGGLNLSRIQAITGVQISQIDESSFSVFAPNPQSMAAADRLINQSLSSADKRENLEFGQIYEAKIVDIKAGGVYVVLERDGQPICGSDKPTFLPSSQLDHRKVEHVSALGFQNGQKIQVKYFGIDAVSGATRLSRKVLFAPPTSSKRIDPAKPR